jgi:hypothetical protein
MQKQIPKTAALGIDLLYFEITKLKGQVQCVARLYVQPPAIDKAYMLIHVM